MWAWQHESTNLRCVIVSRFCMLNLSILQFQLVTSYGWKRFLLPVTYFSANQVYSFTLQVTGIIIKEVHYMYVFLKRWHFLSVIFV